MSKSLIAQLKTLIERKCNKEEYEEHEDLIIEEIGKFIDEEKFYELPTNEILKIISKSNIYCIWSTHIYKARLQMLISFTILLQT